MEKESKQLGLFDIFCPGLGGAIGSGIFVMMGSGIAATGRSIFISVAFGCLFMLMAYFFHVVMTSMFVLEGGDYDMKAMLFNPPLTGVSAVFTMMGGIGFAMYGGAIADYASMVFPVIGEYTKLVGVGIITLFFAATIKGSSFVSKINNVMTVVLIASIALFVIMGLPKVQPGFFDPGRHVRRRCFRLHRIPVHHGLRLPGYYHVPHRHDVGHQELQAHYPAGRTAHHSLPGSDLRSDGCGCCRRSSHRTGRQQEPGSGCSDHLPQLALCDLHHRRRGISIATSLISGIAMMRYPAMRVAQDGWLPDFFKKTTKSGYPWVIQLTFYLFSILPIIFGFSLDSIVSLTMIPSMLMCFAQNISLIKIVKKFPKQWNESVIHMPTPVFNVLCVIAGICDLIVAYNLFVTMDV